MTHLAIVPTKIGDQCISDCLQWEKFFHKRVQIVGLKGGDRGASSILPLKDYFPTVDKSIDCQMSDKAVLARVGEKKSVGNVRFFTVLGAISASEQSCSL